MLKMVDGTGIIGVDMVCPLGGAVSPPQPPNYDNVEMEGVGSLVLPNSLKAPLERLELIGNSTQGENPAPDNPQEIKSAGRKSKNLFNIADLRVGQVQKDGTINEKQIYYRTVILDVPQDGKYRITFNSNDDYTMLYFTEAYANGAYSNPYIRVHAGNPNYYITLAKGKNILSFSTHTASGNIAFTTDHNIMIAAESETLDYEPYGYFFDLKITGKNLFDREKARDITNWIVRDGNGYAKFPIRVGKGNKVTFYYSEKLTTGKGFYVGITQSETSAIVSWLYHSAETNFNNKKYTAVAAGDYIYLSCAISGIQKFVDTIQTLQVEIGSEPTPYELYTEQALTLTSDRPVTKWDKLVEQDGQIGWLYKHRIVNDLSALVKDSEPIYGKDGEKYFSVSLQGALFNYDYNKIYSVAGLCPKDSKIHYVPKPMLQSVVIYVSDTDTIMTAKEHMHYKVIYETTDSQFAPLSESEQTQLRNLHSYNGTTNITVDSGEVPCGIKLTYRKEI